MRFQFFFKQMETSKALQDYARNRLMEKVERFSTKPIETHLSFSLQGGKHHIHCSVSGGDGFNVDVEGETHDMYATVDLVTDKLVAQLKKHKEKLKNHKGNANVRSLAEFAGRKTAKEEGPDFVDAEDILKYEQARKRLRN